MSKVLARYIVDILLLISFILVAVTGILKMPAWIPYFSWAYAIVPRGPMSQIHDLSGLVMTILVVVHLVFNWNFMKAMTAKYILRK